MLEEIYNKLKIDSERLQDNILTCMTNLNELDMYTPDELEMTEEEITKAKKKDFDSVENLLDTKKRFDYWIELFDKKEINDEKLDELFQEFPELNKKSE